jgi:hypothetical protein
MDIITDKTKIADLAKINIPKCYEKYVNKAITCSTKLLTMREFIEKTEFNIHPETFDILFTNINDEGIPIYIDASILEWMGYSTKQKLTKHIERNFEEDIDYKILKNNAYADFLEEEKEKIVATQYTNLPEPSTNSSANTIKHLIVMPDAFRLLCMMINTDKGKYIKKYYTVLEKLIKAYFIYQCSFKELCYKEEINKLKKLPHIIQYKHQQNKIRLHEEIKNINKVGCVYFIQEEITKNIKIGYTFNLPNRICELQTANSQKLHVIKVIECKKPRDKEQELHKLHKKYHIRGEWYKADILG